MRTYRCFTQYVSDQLSFSYRTNLSTCCGGCWQKYLVSVSPLGCQLKFPQSSLPSFAITPGATFSLKR